ncbi:MAG TPA: excinuclease ABC subunit UvrC [Steroidobacteraceae bacterium]|nr:excinuclease ABC subunit UvrC [Steroidobacteraceae bacterium]
MTEFDARAFLATLTRQPGVYRMLDATGKVIYVGKARNLKARVSSYFSAQPHTAKTMAMLAQVASVEVTATTSEIEALLLECNLIKRHRPRYNVMLRDDKSFPYIHLSTHEFPRLSFYRGSKKIPGKLFGPYPNAGAVRETLLEVQKLFGIRPCTDIFFANRSRPCLQFQIKRCSAPCVGEISRESYAEDVKQAVQVLEGRNEELVAELAKRMEQAATQLEFERAARLRDRIQAIKNIQSNQSMNSRGADDVDAVACVEVNGQFCIGIVYVRGGRNLGSANFFPKAGIAEKEEVLASFVTQHYLEHEAPGEIIVDTALDDAGLIASTISQHVHHQITLRHKVRGQRARWLEMARGNAELGLRMRQSSETTMTTQLQELAVVLQLPQPPRRLECFDISHTMGEATVASCVVFNAEGPLKSDYRRFNIEGLTPGDDYGALRQAITRRYARIKRGEVPLPDVLFIDGGENQLAVAVDVLNELHINDIRLVGVAKGADRRAGQERLFIANNRHDNDREYLERTEVATTLPPDSAALHLIQRIRDEAHRFAITGHRQRRGKARQQSLLESIPGLGPRRRRQLLQHFGGMQGVKRASSEDLQTVKGISPALADVIFSTLHPE